MRREETTIPNTEFVTATGNYDTTRKPIDRIVIHSTVGTVASAIAVFGNPAKGTSAHYIVGNDGSLWQGLEEYYTAYHSGNYAMNQRSIGIEHEWYQGIHPSDALYKKAGALVRDICTFYNLPINRTTVIPHKEVVATGCPNEIDVDRIIAEANGTVVVDDCPAKLAEKTALETELRGIIEQKDQTIAHLGDTINAKNAEIASLTTTVSSLNEQVLTLTSSLASCQEQAKKVPGLTQSLADCEASRTAYMEENSKLKEKITKIKSALVPKKYFSLKLYNFLMSLE